jgi:uncharacterized protein (DUF1499 family)
MTTNVPTASPSIWVSRAVLVDGVFAPVLLLVAALGTQFGIWTFGVGLMLMAAATLVAAFGVLGALVALFLARRPGAAAGRSPALVGLALCAAVLGVVLFYALPARSVPPIHDIATDVADPPQFSPALLALRGPDSNPLARTPEVDSQQQAAYADLAPITLGQPVAAVHERALAVVREMGWEVVTDAPAEGRIEATATTRWMGFKDDIAIRIRSGSDGGSVVDLRSVSRVGVSDVGANAARIRAFAARLAGE